MVAINNISSRQSLSSLNNQIIVVRWLMIYLDLHFIVRDYHSLVAKYRHLCSWSHTVHGHILFGHDYWARCHEDTPCAWSHIIIAVDHTYMLQLRDVIGHITLEKCFNLKHCHFIKWHHWCHRPKQCSSFVIDFMGQDYWTRLLAKFIVIFYIWCYYFIVAYVHLRLRLNFNIYIHPSITTSTTVLL